MPQFQTRTDSPVENPEVPQIHVSTGEESSGSGTDFTQDLGSVIDVEESREAPELLAWGLAFPEATIAGS